MDKFKSWEVVTLRPKDVSALQSEVKQVAGWGCEVISGGGDGVELGFAGSDEDPFGDAARLGSARPGELLIGPFSRIGARWPATGIAVDSDTPRTIKLRVYKERGIARVHLLSGDMLKHERKLLRNNSSSALSSNLAAGDSQVVFNTLGYEPLPDDHWTIPGPGTPFREEEGWLEIILGASGAVDGTGITTAPLLLVFAQHRLQNQKGARSLWWAQRLTERPTSAGWPANDTEWATSWDWSLMPIAINVITAGTGAPAIAQRIPYPPNGCRIELFNPNENSEALQWEGSVYVSGRP